MSLKIKIKRVAGVPTTSDLETGEIGLNTSNNQLYVNIGGTITAVSGGSGGGGAVDLSAVSQDIIPDADGTRDLGSPTKKWAELYLSGNTIFLGDAQIKADGATLKDADDNNIAVTNEEGVAVRIVPLFTAASGLNTVAKKLTFKSESRRSVTYKDTFTKADGSSLSTTNALQLFTF